MTIFDNTPRPVIDAFVKLARQKGCDISQSHDIGTGLLNVITALLNTLPDRPIHDESPSTENLSSQG